MKANGVKSEENEIKNVDYKKRIKDALDHGHTNMMMATLYDKDYAFKYDIEVEKTKQQQAKFIKRRS